MSDEAKVFPVLGGSSATPAWVSDEEVAIRPAVFRTIGSLAEPEPPMPEEPEPEPVPVEPPPPDPAIIAAEQELRAQAAAFAEAAAQLTALFPVAIAQAEEQLLQLAVELAGAIIDHEVEARPELHVAMARAAIGALAERSKAVLKISREGYAAMVDALGEAAIVVDGVRVHIELAPALTGLGCVVDNGDVQVDARVAERLRAVRETFMEEHGHRNPEATS